MFQRNQTGNGLLGQTQRNPVSKYQQWCLWNENPLGLKVLLTASNSHSHQYPQLTGKVVSIQIVGITNYQAKQSFLWRRCTVKLTRQTFDSSSNLLKDHSYFSFSSKQYRSSCSEKMCFSARANKSSAKSEDTHKPKNWRSFKVSQLKIMLPLLIKSQIWHENQSLSQRKYCLSI